MGFLARLWSVIRGGTRSSSAPLSTIELLQRAERARREGRPQDAERFVAQVLSLDPNNVLAYLLAGYLHAASRRREEARRSFQAVLALDSDHPRGMLGLARVELEDGDLAGARTLLERALRFFPEFPEARALLDMVASLAATVSPAEAALAPGIELRLQQLVLPEGTRECLIVQTDGAVLYAYPVSRTRDALAAHLVRVVAIASATLGRAGLGPLHRAAIDSNTGTTFIQADARLIVTLTFPRDGTVAYAHRALDAVWARSVEELSAGAERANG